MRVSINSSIASLVVDLKEEQVLELMRTVLDKVSGKPVSVPTPTQVVAAPPMIQQVPVEKVIPVPVTEPVKKVVRESTTPIPATPKTQKEYKGFLYIECEECGNFKAFMPKTPINRFRCDCGHETKLQDLKEMYVDCKCGKSFKYMTNAKDSVISIECYACGAPVDLEYHERKDNYQTIQ